MSERICMLSEHFKHVHDEAETCPGCGKCQMCFPHHIYYSDIGCEHNDDASPFGDAPEGLTWIDDGCAFLYDSCGTFRATAYMIVPDAGETHVHHQYNGACCDQFDMEHCQLFAWEGSLADDLQRVMRDSHRDEVERVVHSQWPNAEVEINMEALIMIRPEFGTAFYVATQSSD